MAKGKKKINQNQVETKPQSKKKRTTLFGLVGLLLITLVVSFVVNIDNGESKTVEIPKKLAKYELVGSEKEVRATLLSLMENPTGEFIYIYKPGCTECSRMNSLLFPLAEEKEITIHRLDIVKYKGLIDLFDLNNNIFPTTIYYSGGHKIGFISGSEKNEYYTEFFDHFYSHHEKHPEEETKAKTER